MECNKRCRVVTGRVNDSLCNLHRCWECGSAATRYVDFFFRKIGKVRRLMVCSDACSDVIFSRNKGEKL